jgi:hypothetical protein
VELITNRLAIYGLAVWLFPRGELSPISAQNSDTQNAIRELRFQLNWDGESKRPLFPGQVQPESEVPFVQYYINTIASPDMWWLMTDEVTFVINDVNLARSGHTGNILINLLRRGEETARDINEYLLAAGEPIEYNYLTFALRNSLSPEPATQEGGRHQRTLTFSYDYAPMTGIGL